MELHKIMYFSSENTRITTLFSISLLSSSHIECCTQFFVLWYSGFRIQNKQLESSDIDFQSK